MGVLAAYTCQARNLAPVIYLLFENYTEDENGEGDENEPQVSIALRLSREFMGGKFSFEAVAL